MSFVEARNIAKSYGERPIIANVNLDVDQGAFISVVGASGCGKSTFLRLLLAQEQPTKGTIRLAGQEPAKEPGLDRGIVFQRYSVFPHMTVRDNIVAGESFHQSPVGKFFGKRLKDARDRAQEVLDRIGLGHMSTAYPSALSGGMQQRLAIAQALQDKPKLLLLDEPFGALDPGTKLSMHNFLEDLRTETGMTVFMVTHDLEEAFKLGDRVIVFDKPSWDVPDPDMVAATITYDFDARDGGIPFQTIKEETNLFHSE
ncbi:MAG: ATP-binding cassette domain-containing protein [Pseudomonadota bacterium]